MGRVGDGPIVTTKRRFTAVDGGPTDKSTDTIWLESHGDDSVAIISRQHWQNGATIRQWGVVRKQPPCDNNEEGNRYQQEAHRVELASVTKRKT